MPQPTRSRPALFVFATVMLDSVGIGLILPVMPELLRELSGLSIGDAAIWGGYLAFSYATMQFLFSPLVGGLSDRYGRRPVLLLSLVMLAVDYVIMATAPALWVLFVGRILAGIGGATYSTATAYIADVTPRAERSAAFGLVGAAFGVGFVLGPAIGGLLAEFGTRAPFWGAAAAALLNCCYGLAFLPESLPPERRRQFDWRRANPLGAVVQLRRVPMVAWFVFAYFLFGLSHNVYPAIWSFFAKARFAWDEAQIGISLALVGVGFAVVQGGMIRPILRHFGEIRTAYFGIVVNVAGMILFAFAWQGWHVYALVPITALGAIVTPALTGLMSNRVPDNAQGELQGVLSSTSALVAIASPILMTQIFGAFTGPDAPVELPGAPFLFAAVIMLLVTLPLMRGLAVTPPAQEHRDGELHARS